MLCRILTELKLLQTQVGVVVLSAGVSNDVIGWILLALCVALVNASSGVTAVYVLLTCVAWVLFLVYAVRPVFIIILRRSGSLSNGPSQAIVGLTVLMVFASAFFTGIIGVHPIFGAFLVGLICPHEGGFAIKITEKIEDLVAVFFLPLYFALSGLSTNLGLLNTGITWAYVVGVIAVAFVAKVTGGTLAARANKLVWRESFTIGVLMSCKGLVELIVLVREAHPAVCSRADSRRTSASMPKFSVSALSQFSWSWLWSLLSPLRLSQWPFSRHGTRKSWLRGSEVKSIGRAPASCLKMAPGMTVACQWKRTKAVRYGDSWCAFDWTAYQVSLLLSPYSLATSLLLYQRLIPPKLANNSMTLTWMQ